MNLEAYNWGEWSLVRQHYTFLEHRHSTLQREGCAYTRWRWRVLEPDNIPLKRQSFPKMALLLEPLRGRERQRKRKAFVFMANSLTHSLLTVSPMSFGYVQGGSEREKLRDRDRERKRKKTVWLWWWMGEWEWYEKEERGL